MATKSICPQCHRLSRNERGVCFYCHANDCAHEHETITTAKNVISVCIYKCDKWKREFIANLPLHRD